MTGIIVVLPKIDDAKNMKNLLVRNGISVSGVCTTGAQAIAMADNLNDGIIICGYKLADMIYSQLHDCLPFGFEMLLMASQQIIGGGMIEQGIMCLTMPLKVHDLINTEKAKVALKTKGEKCRGSKADQGCQGSADESKSYVRGRSTQVYPEMQHG